MKNKFLLTLLCLVCALCCAPWLAACGESGNEQTQTVAVTAITLNKSTLTLDVGGEETLTATVKPDNATNKEVTWRSSNTDVATVDTNGKVIAVAQGTAVISAYAVGGTEISKACTVTVNEVHTHSLTPVAAKDASCTENGNTAYYTCGCGKWFADEQGENEIKDKTSVVIAKTHKLTPVAANEANCTENGNTSYYTCDVCEKWFSDEHGENEIKDKTTVVTAKKEHRLTPVYAEEATCTEDGNTAYYACSACGKWFADEDGKNEITDKTSVVIAKGHKLTPVAAKGANCTENGNTAYYTCSGCAKWFADEHGENEIKDKTSVVIAKGHKLTPVAASESTCNQNGNTAYYTCSGCDKWFVDEQGKNEIKDKTTVVTAKKEHNYENRVCPVCGAKQPTEGLDLKCYVFLGFAEVTGIGTATDTDIVIPSEYEGKPVTRIGSQAFYRCTNLTSVTIPDSVTEIGGSAFQGCTNLTSVIIPDSVTEIAPSVFYECSSLTSVTIPDSVTDISRHVFYGCTSLTGITFRGTIAQWNAISKGDSWDSKTGSYIVYCTDGNIAKTAE